MAQRVRLRRKLRRSAPKLRRQTCGSGPVRAREGVGQGSGLMIGGALDPAEKQADRTAERVMRMTAPAPLVRRSCPDCAQDEDGTVHRKCAACAADEEETVARSSAPAPVVAPGAASAPASAHATQAIGNLGSGRGLSGSERAFFEPRFGRDLGEVRVHDGTQADRASKSIQARAFAHGSDIAFARGAYAPDTEDGRTLMAHELAHVTEGAPATARLRREPETEAPEAAADKDPLCDEYVFIVDRLVTEHDVDAYAGDMTTEKRHEVIRDLKIFHRCATPEEIAQIKAYLESKLGAEEATAIWTEARKAFGGYTGAYPGYYNSKSRLKNLGVSKTEGFAPFNYPEPYIEPAKFDPRGKAKAKAMAGMMERVDLLYFYGHQYAQYGNPGAFANWHQDRFVDLRKLEGEGDFSQVKLIISTSCATICAEALAVFTKLFPNAVILGYRKSAPKEGEAVRNAFDKAVTGLKKPLLLDQPVDIAAIISAWQKVVKAKHPNEAKSLPGYYKDGEVHYLEHGKWASMPGSDAANSCRKKGTRIQEAR